MTHALKTWPQFFKAVVSGEKTFEVRKNDRNFQVGDKLLLQEWDPVIGEYTRNEHEVIVCYLLEGGSFGVYPDSVVMGLKESTHYA